MKIGFIGLGRMGAGMAVNLLNSGHDVSVYNRTRAKADRLADHGARIANSPREAASNADAVMTMLADDHAVDEVTFGADGIIAGLKKDGVHVSNSTISTAMVRRLAHEHQQHGQRYISAPVFGRPEAAESKQLVVVAAGTHEVVERCKPLLDAIGRQTIVAGEEPTQANVIKLCGNFMIASMMEALGEAYAVMRKSSLDPKLFLEIINGLFRSPVYENYGKIIADEKFEPAGFALKLGLKDTRLVLAASEECNVPMPLASLIRDHMITALAQGQADLDWSSVARVSRLAAGV